MTTQGPQDPKLDAIRETHMDKIIRRRELLKDKIPQPPGEVGGLIGQAIHLGKYQWEGLAAAMIVEEIYFLMSILFAVSFLEDQMYYELIPDECKLDLDNYDPDKTPIFDFVMRGSKVELDFSRPITNVDDITPLHMVANGYMHTPNLQMSYRRRFGEYMTTMMGGTCDPEWDAVYASLNQHGGQFLNDPNSPANQSMEQLIKEQQMMKAGGPGRV